MTSEYQVRLDKLHLTHRERVSYSTVLLAERGDKSIHWGNASFHGDVEPIVNVKFGFLSIMVDEAIVGRKKLQALQHTTMDDLSNTHQESAYPLLKMPYDVRRDAAYAAIEVGHFKLAQIISPETLFNSIVDEVLRFYASKLTPEGLTALLYASMENTILASEAAFDAGKRAAKAELRNWLGNDRLLIGE